MKPRNKPNPIVLPKGRQAFWKSNSPAFIDRAIQWSLAGVIAVTVAGMVCLTVAWSPGAMHVHEPAGATPEIPLAPPPEHRLQWIQLALTGMRTDGSYQHPRLIVNTDPAGAYH